MNHHTNHQPEEAPMSAQFPATVAQLAEALSSVTLDSGMTVQVGDSLYYEDGFARLDVEREGFSAWFRIPIGEGRDGAWLRAGFSEDEDRAWGIACAAWDEAIAEGCPVHDPDDVDPACWPEYSPVTNALGMNR